MECEKTIAYASMECLRKPNRPTSPLDCAPRQSTELIGLSRRIAGVHADPSAPVILLLDGDDEDGEQ